MKQSSRSTKRSPTRWTLQPGEKVTPSYSAEELQPLHQLNQGLSNGLSCFVLTLISCLLFVGCGNLNPNGSVKKRQGRLNNGTTVQTAPIVNADQSKVAQDLAAAWTSGAFEWQPTTNEKSTSNDQSSSKEQSTTNEQSTSKEQPKVMISCGDKEKCPEALALIQIKTPNGFRFCSGTAIGTNRILTHKSCLESEISPNCAADISAVFSTDDKFTKFATVKCQKIQYVSASTAPTSLELSGKTFERPTESLAIIETVEPIKNYTNLKRTGFTPKESYYYWAYQIEKNEKSEVVAKVTGRACTTSILTEFLPASVDDLSQEMILSGPTCNFSAGSLGAPIFSKQKQEFVGLIGPVILEPKALFQSKKLKVKDNIYVPSRAQSFKCADAKALASGNLEAGCSRSDDNVTEAYNRAVNSYKKSSRSDALIAGAKEWLLKSPPQFHYEIKFDKAKIKEEEEKNNLGGFWMFMPKVACMKEEKISQDGDIPTELPYFSVVEGIDEYGKKGYFTDIAGTIKAKFQVNTDAISSSGATVVLAENQKLDLLPLDLTGFFGEARFKADFCKADDLKVSEFSADTFSDSHQSTTPSK